MSEDDVVAVLLSASSTVNFDNDSSGLDPLVRLSSIARVDGDLEASTPSATLVVAQLLNLLVSRKDLDYGPPPEGVKLAFEVVGAALPSCQLSLVTNSMRDLAEGLISRYVIAAEAGARAPRSPIDAHSLGGVTFATARPDSAQPKAGNIGALQKGEDGQVVTVRLIPAAGSAARVNKSTRARPTEPPFSEMASLRALLFWFAARSDPAVRATVLDVLHDFLLRYADGFRRDPATARFAAPAVRGVLQIVFASLRGHATHRRIDSNGEGMLCEDEHGSGNTRPPPTLGRWLEALLPLHDLPGSAPDGTSSALAAIHEPLTQCVFLLLTKVQPPSIPLPQLVSSLCAALSSGWLEAMRGNTSKGVLLLHELEQVVSRLPQALEAAAVHTIDEQFLLRACVLPAIRSMVSDALCSDNSRIAQLGLGLFRQAPFTRAVLGAATDARTRTQAGLPLTSDQEAAAGFASDVVSSLVRDGKPHWNATVNKQTHAVLTALLQEDAATLEHELAKVWGDSTDMDVKAQEASEPSPAKSGVVRSSPEPPAQPVADSQGFVAPLPRAPSSGPPRPSSRQIAVGGSMFPSSFEGPGTGRQPPLSLTAVAPWASGPGSKQPPVTITGVAPWAFSIAGSGGGKANPPLTLTGVAPWAQPAAAKPSVPSASGAVTAAQPRLGAVPTQVAVSPAPVPSSAPRAPLPAWRVRLDRYMSRLLPPPAPALDLTPATLDGLPPSLSATHTRLPSLGFHDLVFGQELGSGTFSAVRYAKHIHRGAPGSAWPAYAVKVVSSALLAEMGYEPSVRREVAVLSRVAHPNVCRLVSSFRWRDGVYLVLELGDRGDLHAAAAGLGSLEEDAARFLLGEVVSALRAVHSLGFAHGDVKPENVLLAEDAHSGAHAKLGDFGAVRPVTPAGEAIVAGSRSVLRDLRDGDWRAMQQQQQLRSTAQDACAGGAPTTTSAIPDVAIPEGGGGSPNSEDESDDGRVEGTAEYLAPELADGHGTPTVATDAYALGVTLFQVLCGRFPDTEAMWPRADDSSAGAEAPRKVRFSAGGPPGDAEAGFPPSFPASADARSLVRQLLHPDPAQRLGGGPGGFEEVAEHPWFAALGCGLDALHARPGPKLPVAAAPAHGGGAGGGATDPAWARRHNSTIWAPLPRTYTAFTSGQGSAGASAHPSSSRPAHAFTPAELERLEVLPPLPPA